MLKHQFIPILIDYCYSSRNFVQTSRSLLQGILESDKNEVAWILRLHLSRDWSQSATFNYRKLTAATWFDLDSFWPILFYQVGYYQILVFETNLYFLYINNLTFFNKKYLCSFIIYLSLLNKYIFFPLDRAWVARWTGNPRATPCTIHVCLFLIKINIL